jgi:hypothetical protein
MPMYMGGVFAPRKSKPTHMNRIHPKSTHPTRLFLFVLVIVYCVLGFLSNSGVQKHHQRLFWKKSMPKMFYKQNEKQFNVFFHRIIYSLRFYKCFCTESSKAPKIF